MVMSTEYVVCLTPPLTVATVQPYAMALVWAASE
jgi:hypothetical protein